MITEDKGTAEKVRNWWSTEIIDIRPGKIRIRGENIEDLIGKTSFVQMIWLMIQGKMPEVKQARLLEAALVPGVVRSHDAREVELPRLAAPVGRDLGVPRPGK